MLSPSYIYNIHSIRGEGSGLGGGGEGVTPPWAIQGCAARQGVVFWPRCPEQGIQFDLPLS